MDNMSEQEICDFCQSAVKALTEEKKEEVMKCVGQFVYNPKIGEINKKIAIFQKQCNDLGATTGQARSTEVRLKVQLFACGKHLLSELFTYEFATGKHVGTNGGSARREIYGLLL